MSKNFNILSIIFKVEQFITYKNIRTFKRTRNKILCQLNKQFPIKVQNETSEQSVLISS